MIVTELVDRALTPRALRVSITQYNKREQIPLYIWTGPHYGNINLNSETHRLKATAVESMIIEMLRSADYPFLFLEEGEYYGMRIYSSKDRTYYGSLESIDIRGIKVREHDGIYGKIAGADAPTVRQEHF